MFRALLRSITAAGLLATPALAHDGCELSSIRFALSVPFVRVGTPYFQVGFDAGRRVHRHAYVAHTERIWIGPVYETRTVGRDGWHRPLFRRVLVQPGHFESRIVRTCACGAGFGR